MATNNVIICPDCGANNFLGEEECGSCHAPLVPFDHTPDRGDRTFISTARIDAVPLREALTVSRATSLREALGKMRDALDPSVLVVDGDRLVGIVTERDVLYKIAGSGRDLDATTVADVMTPDPVKLNITDRVSSAFNRMSVGGFRHLPILSEGRIVGQLTMKSLLEFLRQRKQP